MLRVRIVSVGVAAAIAVVLAVSGATAQTATTGQAGKPMPLLAGLRPPHEAKAHGHAKTAHRTSKKTTAGKLAARTKLASKQTHHIAATQEAQPPAQPAQTAPPANIWPAADAAPPADIAAASPPQTALPDDDPTPSEIMVGGQTVQIASPDQVNAIDLAADDDHDAAPTAPRSDRVDAAAASQAVLAAPVHDEKNPVGSASWIAQVLAALGGAIAAGAVAWFLIGSGPQRMYG